VKVRIAVAPGGGGFDAGSFGDFVGHAERLGFDTIWLSDVPMAEVVDPIIGLTFAAGRTSRLKLGANIVPIGRNPMLLAKELAQLDQLSGGRLLLSLVPGLDQPGEREALGIGRANRGGYLDEVMPLLRRALRLPWCRGAAAAGAVIARALAGRQGTGCPRPGRPAG
jgi:alkanesulfonate monooxygenase SsuD/methylene tetrahydromethanopterin reductase-like flavin-dependent oxidoreductase (luciferase family)